MTVVARGREDPVAVGGVGVGDGYGENLGRVVGVVAVGAFDDGRHKRLTGVKDDERLVVVFDGAFPAVDGADVGNDVAAGGEAVVDDRAGEVREPVGALGGDADVS